MYKKIIFSFVILTLCSCDDFLEVDEVGKTSTPTYFSDLDGIRSAVPGAYSSVYEYYDSEFYLYPQVAGDLLDLVAIADGLKMIDQYNFTSEPDQEVSAVGHIWSKELLAMANVNNILKYQPELLGKYPDDRTELQRIKAQALFLRALIHFDLVRTYAQPYTFTENASHIGVPVLLESPGADDNVSRKSVAEVYAQILDDLKNAEVIFQEEGESPSHNRPYFASSIAVKAFLSRVYLYMENWEKAIEYAQYVLAEVELTPNQDYVNMFRTLESGREAIFVLNGESKNSDVGKFYATPGGAATASNKLKQLFTEPSDVRLKLFEQNSQGGDWQILKYSRPEVDPSVYGSNLFVLRASELVLNLAEAKANLDRIDEASEAIKTLKSRALGLPVDEITIAAKNKEEMLKLIADERSKELSFEGHRFFDLTRRKMGLSRSQESSSIVKELTYPNNLFVLPIPLSEMNTNDNMIQNEGY